MFLKLFLQFYLYTYAGNVNNILKGNVLENINNNVKKQALVRYRKYKKKIVSVTQTEAINYLNYFIVSI
jgi:hypothetical protein